MQRRTDFSHPEQNGYWGETFENLISKLGLMKGLSFLKLTTKDRSSSMSTSRRATLAILYLLRGTGVKFLSRIETQIMRVRDREKVSKTFSTSHKGTVGIVVTTFEERQFDCCLPLLRSIRNSGCEMPIVVCINGNILGGYSERDRQEFIAAANALKNISFVTFRSISSLSRIWNLGIQALATEVAIVLNDDLAVRESGLHADLKRLSDAAQHSGIALGNNSFSHFAVTRNLMEELRWFDERFVGIGEEDGDFAWRYEHRFGDPPSSLVIPSLKNYSHPSGDYFKDGGRVNVSRTFARLKYEADPAGLTGGKYPVPMRQVIADFDPHPLSGVDEWREEALSSASETRITDLLTTSFGHRE